MEEALTSLLLDDAMLGALVGDRIHWVTRPQGSDLPAVVLNKIDALPDYTMQGPSGLSSNRIQVDCLAASYGEVKAVARAVAAILSGLDETIGDGNSPERLDVLRGGFQQGERENFELSSGQAGVFSVSLDFIIWHGLG
jgi:hypothetical protein